MLNSTTHSNNSHLENTEFIILAAGKGTRIGLLDINKTMLQVGGKPLLEHAVSLVEALSINKPIVVVGFAKESIQSYFGDRVRYAEQRELNGTAGAVKTAIPFLPPDTKHVIVLLGDHSFFFTKDMIHALCDQHVSRLAQATLLTTKANDPTGFGRIIRDSDSQIERIVEEKVASEAEKKIQEINTGNGMYSVAFLKKYIDQIKKNPTSQEYYFTDIVELGREHREVVYPYYVEDEKLSVGINTREHLQIAEQLTQVKDSK